jgi:toxin YoeB
VKVHVTSAGWEDYTHWAAEDAETLRKVNELIREIRRTPFQGIGKPEPLKGMLSGWWSRRITREHRLVYRVAGDSGAGPAGRDRSVPVSLLRA